LKRDADAFTDYLQHGARRPVPSAPAVLAIPASISRERRETPAAFVTLASISPAQRGTAGKRTPIGVERLC
jgi:hypothetical protein